VQAIRCDIKPGSAERSRNVENGMISEEYLSVPGAIMLLALSKNPRKNQDHSFVSEKYTENNCFF
jgi:hypothetical protein